MKVSISETFEILQIRFEAQTIKELKDLLTDLQFYEIPFNRDVPYGCTYDPMYHYDEYYKIFRDQTIYLKISHLADLKEI